MRDVGLYDDEITYLLNNDINKVEEQLDAHFGWWRDKPDPVRRMMTNFVFNVGIGTARTFVKMMGAIERDNAPLWGSWNVGSLSDV